jgi:hypothetical protein
MRALKYQRSPQSGGRNSPDIQPDDFSGSGTVTVSMKLHLGHSKMRFSLWSGSRAQRGGDLRRVRQGGQVKRGYNTFVAEIVYSLSHKHAYLDPTQVP